MKESKKPQLRFKGYSEDWEEKTLGEVSDFNPKSEIPNIFKYVDLESVSGTQLLQYRTETKDSAPSRAQRLARKNDIFYQTVRPYQKNNFLYDKDDLDFVFSTGYAQIRPFIDSSFLFTKLQEDEFVKLVLDNCTGTSYPAINSNTLENLSVYITTNSIEQTKIGTLFKNIDTLITSKKAKYEKLLQIKKSLLEKMFPQDGQATPALRFKGFTEDWKEKTMGEIMNITSVKRIHQSDWTNKGIKFLRARDIVASYKNEKITDNLFISKQKYDEYTSISGKVKIEDLLVTGVGTIGIPMQIENLEPVYFKDGNIIWFQNSNKINGNFFYYSFCGKKIQYFIKESAGTGTVGTYTIESGKKTPIILPIDKAEQTKIGNFFKQLDTLLSLQKKELDKLQNVKKALLERMFV
ncbi:restriction endonuclease subunit S [Treponema brennaborense]|uniref:Restriction modification system DNA specificity domain protein n=1 Tax=Treponema brennaborense (strain DSM 12168 / CIP 105900 / DD5/3) TaxID=906968 RepID=F4LNK0_TREBD|nr:restriction endonuclease subunit S [Treponema brennaborense]AEE15854.1 restriction modification system DNA specificity domain protein [Treponema brennaborense DSM 12168]